MRSRTFCAATVLYLALAAGTIQLTSDGGDIASVWPANAALLAFLLVRERGGWLEILGAGLIGNFLATI